MIQRIQTLFLIVVNLLTASLFFTDLAAFTSKTTAYKLTYEGVFALSSTQTEAIMPTIALSILLIAALLATTASIFLYKNRLLQIRVCGINIGLQLGLTVMIYLLSGQISKELAAETVYKLPMILPIASVILIYLAIRHIGKDEALIKSMNRIR